jgi:hypothetical protein
MTLSNKSKTPQIFVATGTHALSFVLTLCAGLVMCVIPALGNGGKSKLVHYQAAIHLGEATNRDCNFTADIDPVVFYLTSVQSKYAVVVIRIVNTTATPLVLSAQDDKMEFLFDTRRVSGVLNLAAADPQMWSSFSLELRQAIAYPSRVEAGEEEGVYLFVAKDALSEFGRARKTPKTIHYAIATQPSLRIELRPPAAVAAKR